MFVEVDYDKRIKDYKIYLAKPNKQIITVLAERYDTNYSTKIGDLNDLTFSVPYYIDKDDERVYNENINLIKEKMYIKIKYNKSEEWMIIDSLEETGNEDGEQYLKINTFNIGYENKGKQIKEMHLETVNATQSLNEVLQTSSWSVGIIDTTFNNMYRNIDLDNTNVLESIIEIAKTFGAVINWDDRNKKIDLVNIQKTAKYKGLHINYRNFLRSMDRKSDTDEMITRMYVYGNEGMSIENANPTGMRYLEDFSYFMQPFKRDANKNVISSSTYMSDELCHALLDLEALTKQYTPQIMSIQDRIDNLNTDFVILTTQLEDIKFQQSTTKGLLDIAKATGNQALVDQRKSELALIDKSLSQKETDVNTMNTTIKNLSNQIINLQNAISVTSFTPKLLDELNPYIIEGEFEDDRYIDEQELYNDAVAYFEKAMQPKSVITASIDNILDSVEEEYYHDKVKLGDLARISEKDMKIDYKSVITQLNFNLDNQECEVIIADEDSDIDGYDKILTMIYSSSSATTKLESSKHKWDSVVEVKTEVDELRDREIDAVRNRITAGVNESVVMDDRGIVLSNPDFPNEMVIMQAGVIALSKDAGETWSTSITPDGVIADTIIGKLIASNNLLITNEKGTFRIDSDGLTIDMDSINISSGSGQTPENMVDSWNAILITMNEFGNDNVLNKYEKEQIKKQWDSIVNTHSSMIKTIQDAYGVESPDNPYPTEYDTYIKAYESLRVFLNVTKQSDGHAILDPNTMDKTTPVDGVKYTSLVNDYQKKKDLFQTKIPLDFAKSSIKILETGISLDYVKNGKVVTALNLTEEGVKIDGRLLEINSKTAFNDDMTMNAGVIRAKDNGFVIDMNKGTIDLARPLTINAVPVATKDDLDALELQEGKSAYDIARENGFLGSEQQWIASLKGDRGLDGDQGIAGEKGADGRTSYTHIAYANTATGGGFSQNSLGKEYIGMYVDFTQTDSSDPSKYKWTLIKGADGSQGVAGATGADGRTPYFHTAWATNETGTTGFSTTVSSGKTHIGTYTDFVSADSTDPKKYSWMRTKGDQGIAGAVGADGKTSYFHVAYANSKDGTVEFSITESMGRRFMGTYTDFTSQSSSDPSKYKWSVMYSTDLDTVDLKDGESPIVSRLTQADGNVYVGVDGKSEQKFPFKQQNYLRKTQTPLNIVGSGGTNQTQGEALGYIFDSENSHLGKLPFKHGDDFVIAFDWEATGSNISGQFLSQFNATPWSMGGSTVTSLSPSNASGTLVFTSKFQDFWSTSVATRLGFRLDNVPTTVTLTIKNMRFQKGTESLGYEPAQGELSPIKDVGIRKNLIDRKKVTGDYYLDNKGNIIASSPWFYTDYIDIEGYSNVKAEGYSNLGFAPSVAYYDSNYNFTRGVNNNGVSAGANISLQNNEKYIRFSGEIKDLNTIGIYGNKYEIDIVSEGTNRNHIIRHNELVGYLLTNNNVNTDGAGKTQRTIRELIPVNLGDKIRFTKTTTIGDTYWRISFYDAKGNYLDRTPTLDNSFVYNVSNSRIKFLRFSYPADAQVKMEFIKDNNEPYIYTPSPEDCIYNKTYKSIHKAKIFLDNPLRQVGDYKDKIYLDENNMWIVERNIGVFNFSNTVFNVESRLEDGYTQGFASSALARGIARTDLGSGNTGISNMFQMVSQGEAVGNAFKGEGLNAQNNYAVFRFRLHAPTRFGKNSTDVLNADYYNYINPLNAEVYYILRDEHRSKEILPKSEQDKLNNIPTYADSTYVYTISDNDVNPVLYGEFKSAGWYRNFKQNKNLDRLENTVLPALSDGLITQSEKKAIQQTMNVVEADRKAIDAQYTSLYGNSALAGVAKTNLGNAKASYNSAYQNLLSSLNDILAVKEGQKVPQALIDLVNSRFTSYGNSLATFNERVDKANDYVSAYYSAQAENGARNYADGAIDKLDINDRNLTTNTSSEMNTVTFGGWDYYFDRYEEVKAGETFTARTWLEPQVHDARVMLEFGRAGTTSYYKQQAGNIIPAGSKGYATVTTNATNDGWVRQSIRHTINQPTSNTVDYKEVKMQRGTKATDWTPAIEDVNDALAGKASQEAVDNISQNVSDLETKIPTEEVMGALQSAIAEYEKARESDANSLTQAQDDIVTMLNRVGLLETNFGEYSNILNFVDTSITMSEEGILIGNQAKQTGIRVSDDRIDFLNGGIIIAHMTGQMLEISRGMFTESMTIGTHVFETLESDNSITVVRWDKGS